MKPITCSLILGAICSLYSCKHKDNVDDQHVTLKDGIIGCTTNSSDKVVAAIDPIIASEFAYSPSVSEGIVVGPSTISTNNLLYYTIAADNNVNEISTTDGNVRRSFKIKAPYEFMVYDDAGKRLLGLSINNDLFEIDLASGQENLIGAIAIDEGVMVGTEFLRNGKLYMMGKNLMMAIDPTNLTVAKTYSFDMQLNSVGYDASKDKMFYLSTPAGSTGISLFEYDFASGTNKALRNYPDVVGFVMHSTAYNEYTGQYHFYSSTTQRTNINVNTLDYNVETVDYYLVNTEVIKGRFELPKKEIKD